MKNAKHDVIIKNMANLLFPLMHMGNYWHIEAAELFSAAGHLLLADGSHALADDMLKLFERPDCIEEVNRIIARVESHTDEQWLEFFPLFTDQHNHRQLLVVKGLVCEKLYALTTQQTECNAVVRHLLSTLNTERDVA